MFSLCIPTMDRYDRFLNKTLRSYINNSFIHEIIICDENGNDVEKIKKTFSSEKLKLYTNEKQLGPFLNKLKCCRFAQNEWIVLMDSDNFADIDYFQSANTFITEKQITKKNVILAPVFAKPSYNFSNLLNIPITTETIKTKDVSGLLLNTGNYVINKYLVDHIDITHELELIDKSSACDVLLFNILLLEQLDMHMYIVPNMTYDHVRHPGSVYLTTIEKTRKYAEIVYKRYNDMETR